MTAANYSATPWSAPEGRGALNADVSLPGSKSLTNRELVLSAIAAGESVLARPLHSRDSALMIAALGQLGVRIDELPATGAFGPDLRVTPPAHGFASPQAPIDCGLAGNVMRFVPVLAALANGPVAFDGDEHARVRPMLATIESLRALGVEVDDDGRGALPFKMHPTGRVRGGELTLDASRSSQFVTALLLSAPAFERGLTLHHEGAGVPSLPHIEMTLDSLRRRGVAAEALPQGATWRVEPGQVAATTPVIEPDLSNAAPFLAAAMLVGGRVTVRDWPTTTTQVGATLPPLLAQLGATVTRDDDASTLTVAAGLGALRGRPLPDIELDLRAAGELVPTIATMLALGGGAATITGVAHIRGHETDRLRALATELQAIGARVHERDDGLVIEPVERTALRPALWHAYADHRMATAGALAGLVVPGVRVDDIGATSKTLPEFAELWARLLAGEDA